jgi:hypothetical protein
VETFLTLIIALGGIAAGIGAIWAALAEHGRILREQNAKKRQERGEIRGQCPLHRSFGIGVYTYANTVALGMMEHRT